MHSSLALDETAENLLQKAATTAGSVSTSPQLYQRRMWNAVSVLVLSGALALGALLTLVMNLAQSDEARLVAMFVLLTSVLVAILATVGFGLVCWSAFLQQRVLAIEASMNEAEATLEAQAFRHVTESANSRAEIQARAETTLPGIPESTVDTVLEAYTILVHEETERRSLEQEPVEQAQKPRRHVAAQA